MSIRAVVTLGAPYLSTTITNVIFDNNPPISRYYYYRPWLIELHLEEILRDVQFDELISRLVVSASLDPNRAVNLHLDQWG